MKNLIHILVATAFLVALNLMSLQAQPAQSGTTANSVATTVKPKRDWYPFRGEIASVNTAENSISLRKKDGARVVHLDSASELKREGTTISASDLKIGEYAHGKLRKDGAGVEFISAASIDREPPQAKPKSAKKRTVAKTKATKSNS